MKRFLLIFKKTLLIFFVLAIYTAVTILFYENSLRPAIFTPPEEAWYVADPTEKTSPPTPPPIPSEEPPPAASASPEIAAAPTPFAANPAIDAPADVLMIPVVGIKREQLQDTYDAARSEGRVHNAIDIMAPGGTPVVAVADGEIVKFFDSERGGITVYQYSADRRYVYYYAHLQKRAENLREKETVKRGALIGYVGDTGNAGAGNFHLHFSIGLLSDPNRYHEATDINPYPLLKKGIEAR